MSNLRPLVHPIADVHGRIEWAQAFDFCWVCRIPRALTHRLRYPPGLQVHHIIKPGRSDEPCNYARVCSRCHQRIEGEWIVTPRGKRLGPISLGQVLWLKQKHDPENWNPERLCELFGRECLPDLEPWEEGR